MPPLGGRFISAGLRPVGTIGPKLTGMAADQARSPIWTLQPVFESRISKTRALTRSHRYG
jgi:hypothetical protein